MRNIFTLGVAVVVLACAGAAFAYPTLTGPTGLAVLPTGYVAPAGFTVAGDWQDLEDGSVVPTRALFGFGSSAELGGAFDFINDDALGLDQAWGANAKIRIGKILGGDSAIGAQFRRETDLADFDTDFTQGYFAWTTGFTTGMSAFSAVGITWGVNWTRLDPEVGDSADDWRFFAGADVRITKGINLVAEYQTDEASLGDADPISAFTARITLSPSLQAQVGTTNAYGLRGLADHNVFAGLTFAFGARGEGGGGGATAGGATCP